MQSKDQTQQNYEAFFNTIDEFLFVLDEQGNIQHINTTVTDRLGYTFEELFGQSVLMVHPEERRSEAGRIVGEMLEGKSLFCPVPLITKSGNLIPVETRVKAGVWGGKPAIFGVTKDISQIKLSEEKFSKVFYINPSACGLSDLDTGRYTEVNEAFYTLFGFNKDEVIGRTADELGIINKEAIKLLRHETDINGLTTNIEADLRTKNGDIKHVLLSTENIFVQDKNLRYTVVHDITLRKQSEIALRESEIRLRDLNATKDKFFSIIGHDLKNPFHAIIGLSSILINQVQENDYEGIGEYANLIKNSATKAMSLLNDLLEWSRIQIGKMTFSPQPLDLTTLIHETIDLASDFAQQKSIKIIIDAPPSIYIIGDKAMISSILRNLISNAIKFSHMSGRIFISIEQESSEIRISVNDEGIGIRKEYLNKLFRIEEIHSTSGTNMETGTGLGLLLCKEFVTKHNGRIWVESEFGIGSKFHFTIPIMPNSVDYPGW